MEQKAKLAKAYGAQAVDMEAAAVARAAESHGVRFLACKVISDANDSLMPPVGRFIGEGGRFQAFKFIAYVAFRPWLWGRVQQLARHSIIAAGKLCEALAATTLRAVIGDIPLDDVLAKREEINNILRAKLDEVTHRWGVKITNVEIREIVPPRDIQEAMNRQMSAERNRRANITESEGTRQATINVAEGDKQSAILRAEGERQAQVLRAEGFSNALKTIFGAAKGVDEKTMTLTKWIVPMELAELSRPLGGMMRAAREAGEPPAKR